MACSGADFSAAAGGPFQRAAIAPGVPKGRPVQTTLLGLAIAFIIALMPR
jgi:hypothetical protein